MIDIHSHILSGIDDGAKDIDISIEMLRNAQLDGITDMCVTPHYIYGEIDNTSSVVTYKLSMLRELSAGFNIKLNLYPGNEIFLSPEVPELIKSGEVMTLNGGRYALVELPLGLLPGYTDKILFEIALLGYTPVIAHPERNYEIGERPEILGKWKRWGMVFQINSSSITGVFGKRVQKIALSLISKGWAGVVASDCHTNKLRSPVLSRARNIVENRFGDEVSRLLFEINGSNILISKNMLDIPKSKNQTFHRIFKLKKAIEAIL